MNTACCRSASWNMRTATVWRFPPEEQVILARWISRRMADAISQYVHERDAEREREASRHLGFIAHELRNPLYAARLAFDRLREKELAGGGRPVEVLDRSLRRTSQLIEETLTRSSLRLGLEPNLEPIDLPSFLGDLERDAAIEGQARNVAVDITAPPGLTVDADPRLLRSAVANLVSNAVKFSRPGTRVQIAAARTETGISIDVADGCGGLPTGKADELFQPARSAGNQPVGIRPRAGHRRRGGGRAFGRDQRAQHARTGLRVHPDPPEPLRDEPNHGRLRRPPGGGWLSRPQAASPLSWRAAGAWYRRAYCASNASSGLCCCRWRRRASTCARESAVAPRLGCRFSARGSSAPARRRPAVRPRLAGGGFSGTPARRALERPMAIACRGDRAAPRPFRSPSISSRTNSPAAVEGLFPSAMSRRAFRVVLLVGMQTKLSAAPQRARPPRAFPGLPRPADGYARPANNASTETCVSESLSHEQRSPTSSAPKNSAVVTHDGHLPVPPGPHLLQSGGDRVAKANRLGASRHQRANGNVPQLAVEHAVPTEDVTVGEQTDRPLISQHDGDTPSSGPHRFHRGGDRRFRRQGQRRRTWDFDDQGFECRTNGATGLQTTTRGNLLTLARCEHVEFVQGSVLLTQEDAR